VTFHDETTVSIECQNCSRGYNPPTGRVTRYVREGSIHLGTITGVEVASDGGIEYRLRQSENSSWLCKEGDLFSDTGAANARAIELAAEADAEEVRRISQKEKPTRTWAWNASYHRSAIKQANSNLEYHTRKLNAANLKAREEKKATPDRSEKSPAS
jgi:hypothetical protein